MVATFSRGTGPDFLGIGAHKAGTTWLHRQLRRHPGLYLPGKELHYFDRSPTYPSPSHLSVPVLQDRLDGDSIGARQWRDRLASIRRNRDGGELLGSRWELLYLFGRYDDDWYRSLFAEADGRVSGEITPAYSILRPDDIGRVVALLPQVKIVFVMRNPVERDWSAFRYGMQRRGVSLGSVSLEEVREFLDREGPRLRGDYLRTVEAWRQQIPEDRFFVGFHDDIVRDPLGFLTRVFGFLGVDQDGDAVDEREISAKANVAPPLDMDPAIRAALSRRHHEQLEGLADMFGGHAERWRSEARSLLAGG